MQGRGHPPRSRGHRLTVSIPAALLVWASTKRFSPACDDLTGILTTDCRLDMQPPSRKVPVCILVVEDEFLIRQLVSEGLQEAGFEVMEAATGDEAVDLITCLPNRFTALVTDFHMPGKTDGSAVAALIREKYPSMPVVIATGRPDIFRACWKHTLGYSLLRKPFTPHELVSLVQRLLDRPEHG